MLKKILFALSLSACATIPKSEQVQIRAAHDFQCEASQVKTTRVDERTFHASACGQEVSYVESCPEVSGQLTRCTWVQRPAGEAVVQEGAPAVSPSDTSAN